MLSDLNIEPHIVKAGRGLRKYLTQCPYFTVKETKRREVQCLATDTETDPRACESRVWVL